MRYRLRTLLIAAAVGPPVLAVIWLYAVPVVPSLAFLLFIGVVAACLAGTALGRVLLWGLEGLLAAITCMTAQSKRLIRHYRPRPPQDETEFSLSRFASEVRARHRE